MIDKPRAGPKRVMPWLIVLGLVVGSPLAWPHEHDVTSPDPGFRPYSELAPDFIAALPDATIAVYPTIIRRAERSAHDVLSQRQIVTTLRDAQTATIVSARTRFDLGTLQYASQWDIFLGDMASIAQKHRVLSADANYHLVMEIVMKPGNQEVFGVHVLILDAQGRNAFSFLLNSHHQRFVDGALAAKDGSETARGAMMDRATRVGAAALLAQIEVARECATHSPNRAAPVRDGVVARFEIVPSAAVDAAGNPIGLVTLGDDASTIRMTRTTAYPTLPPQRPGNAVLQLDVDVQGWVALVHFFASQQANQWIAYDWSEWEQISFWLYGNNSGATLFFHVLDNRKPCSNVDDAERYAYQFSDDFLGWERVTIRFADMLRQDVGNGAPDDGLGLSAVHGWAFGALHTNGPLTFYLDDVELGMKPRGHAGYAINEVPMFGGREKTAAQKKADDNYIKTMTRRGRSRADAAEAAAQTGWNSLYADDESTAIKRFNQAWLLDRDCQLALWGFAAISSNRGELEEGVRYFEMAIARGPPHPSLQRDYEFALKQLGRTVD